MDSTEGQPRQSAEWSTAKVQQIVGVTPVGDVEKNEVEVSSSEVAPFRWSLKRFTTLKALLSLNATAILPFFLIGGSPSSIAASIGGSDSYTWLALVNALALAAVAPFAGHLSDLIGRRYLGIVGTAFVLIGMTVVGTAHDMSVAVGGMAMAGAGSGIAQVIGIAGVMEVVPVKMRARFLCTIYLLFSPMAPAPAYAVIYSVTSSWRWSAWISIAIAGVSFLLVVATYHPPARSTVGELSKKETAGRIDYLGGLLSVSGIAVFLMGLQFAGYNYVWDSVNVIATVAVGGGLIVLFIVWQLISKAPMFPRYMFSNQRVIIPTLFLLFCGGAEFACLAAFYLLEAETIFSSDVYTIARLIIPFGFSFLIGIAAFGWTIDLSKGLIREPFLIASAMMTAGIGAMVAVTPLTSSLSTGLSFLGGLGVGGVYIPAIVVLTIVVPEDLIGSIAGLGLAVRGIGNQVGYTLFYNLFYPKLTTLLTANVGLAVVQAGFPISEAKPLILDIVAKNTTAIMELPGLTPAILDIALAATAESFVQSLKPVFYSSIAFGGAAIVACLAMPTIKKYMTDRVVLEIQ